MTLTVLQRVSRPMSFAESFRRALTAQYGLREALPQQLTAIIQSSARQNLHSRALRALERHIAFLKRNSTTSASTAMMTGRNTRLSPRLRSSRHLPRTAQTGRRTMFSVLTLTLRVRQSSLSVMKRPISRADSAVTDIRFPISRSTSQRTAM